MLDILRRHIPVAVTAAVVCSLFAGGPTVAKAAFDAVNADKVDGKHAVGSGASTKLRKGKLVATSPRSGRLPNNIIAKAPNAGRLDGLDSKELLVTGQGKEGVTVNIDSCGSGPVLSYPVRLTRSARIFASASSGYARSNPGPELPTIRIHLLDGAGTILASSGRVGVAGATGNPSMAVSGVLLVPGGDAAYEAAPGEYSLRIFGDNFGACAGFGQYQSPRLSHMVLASGD